MATRAEQISKLVRERLDRDRSEAEIRKQVYVASVRLGEVQEEAQKAELKRIASEKE